MAYSSSVACFGSNDQNECCQSTVFGAQCWDSDCEDCDPTQGTSPKACDDGTRCLACDGVVISGVTCGAGSPCTCSSSCHCVGGVGCKCTAYGSPYQDNGLCQLI